MALYQVINKFIFDNALIFGIIVPLATGLLSGWLGHWLTKKSENRKKFNDLVMPLYLDLNDLYFNIKENNLPKLYINSTLVNKAMILLSLNEQQTLGSFIQDLENYHNNNAYKWVKYNDGIANIFIPENDLIQFKLKVKKILNLIELK